MVRRRAELPKFRLYAGARSADAGSRRPIIACAFFPFSFLPFISFPPFLPPFLSSPPFFFSLFPFLSPSLSLLLGASTLEADYERRPCRKKDVHKTVHFFDSLRKKRICSFPAPKKPFSLPNNHKTAVRAPVLSLDLWRDDLSQKKKRLSKICIHQSEKFFFFLFRHDPKVFTSNNRRRRHRTHTRTLSCVRIEAAVFSCLSVFFVLLFIFLPA